MFVCVMCAGAHVWVHVEARVQCWLSSSVFFCPSLTALARLSNQHAIEILLFASSVLRLQVQTAVPHSFRWVLRIKQTLMLMKQGLYQGRHAGQFYDIS